MSSLRQRKKLEKLNLFLQPINYIATSVVQYYMLQ